MSEKLAAILPCGSISETVDFYKAIGFEVTFLQERPYGYAVVQHGEVELQFMAIKGFVPAESYGACYITTDDVDGLYAKFRGGLKGELGKIPTRGLPRIGPLKDTTYGVRQFIMADPGGNSIRIGQPISDDGHHSPVPKERVAKALHMASLLGDSKEDYPAAAKILDRLLSTDVPAAARVKALILRAAMAAHLDDTPLAARLLSEADQIPLSASDRASLADDLLRAEDLRDK
ncbi:VOC family protein [Streptomyces sp. TBY4]|uniref:bleomycin resistance protein n=1 Tax=Streptomyces sp. TBY4 TaxID=2962030 RepID=UPI0020B8AFFE|nr:VOC family protein [Streptomyces sp. TBY4]MCP3760754.1 VOC family protein [Streptomyces sp. TBY4]